MSNLTQDDNFITGKTTGQGIEMKMADVYKAIYSTYTNVNVVHIKAYLDITDKYGNVQNSMVYYTALNKETGQRINWNTDSATLELQIVPGLWTKVLEFPFLQK